MIFPLQNPDQEVYDRSQLQTHGWEAWAPCQRWEGLSYRPSNRTTTLPTRPPFLANNLADEALGILSLGDQLYFRCELRK